VSIILTKEFPKQSEFMKSGRGCAATSSGQTAIIRSARHLSQAAIAKSKWVGFWFMSLTSSLHRLSLLETRSDEVSWRAQSPVCDIR
jgi:hypothetical protein